MKQGSNDLLHFCLFITGQHSAEGTNKLFPLNQRQAIGNIPLCKIMKQLFQGKLTSAWSYASKLQCEAENGPQKKFRNFFFFFFKIHLFMGFPSSSLVKNLPMQEIQIWPLGREDPLEKEMATHSSILARRTPKTEEPGGLQSMGL